MTIAPKGSWVSRRRWISTSRMFDRAIAVLRQWMRAMCIDHLYFSGHSLPGYDGKSRLGLGRCMEDGTWDSAACVMDMVVAYPYMLSFSIISLYD